MFCKYCVVWTTECCVTFVHITILFECVLVCCYQLKKNDAKPQSSSSDYGVMIKEVMGKCRGKTRVDPAEMLSARVYASYHDNRTSFMFHMDTDVLLPSLRLRATPVSPVPILATALTRNLCTPMSLSSVQGLPKTGYDLF